MTYPIGTKLEMVGGTSPLLIKIRKFNPPGTGRPSDSTAENLATYSVQSCGDEDSEVWDEPCEDAHHPQSWKRVE